MIIAIDPGKMSGLAAYHDEQFRAYEMNPLDTIEYVDSAWSQTGGDIEVVAESFVISERTIKTAPQRDALDILGWLTIESQRRGFEFTMQTPAQAKKFATDDKLKALDWYERTKDGHANDAARHLLVYLMRDSFYRNTLIPKLAKEILND